jgi:hypothetical protein
MQKMESQNRPFLYIKIHGVTYHKTKNLKIRRCDYLRPLLYCQEAEMALSDVLV